jgi:hypothetical protein
MDMLERGAMGVSGVSGVATVIMDYFNANSAGIGAMCAVGTFLVYLGVSVYNSKRKQDREDKK